MSINQQSNLIYSEQEVPKVVHEIFDDEGNTSIQIYSEEEVVGGIAFTLTSDKKGAYIEFIQAEKRGEGRGDILVAYLFNSRGLDYLIGSTIYEPHFFWKRIGADFDYEVSEDDWDGVRFKLTRASFFNKTTN